jgi:hypothetical protein
LTQHASFEQSEQGLVNWAASARVEGANALMTAVSKIFGAMKPAMLPKRNCAALKRKGRPDRLVVNRKLIFTYIWWQCLGREFMERSTT